MVPAGSTPTRRSRPRASSRPEGHGPGEGGQHRRRVSVDRRPARPGPQPLRACRAGFKVVAYDFGAKRNILRMLAERGCDVTVVPARTPAAEVLAMRPDGVFLSNGPGDPEPCDYAIAAIREFVRGRSRSTASASATSCSAGRGREDHEDGARSPRREPSGAGARYRPVMITSQTTASASTGRRCRPMRVTHRSLFDGSNQGIEPTDAPASTSGPSGSLARPARRCAAVRQVRRADGEH